MATLCKTYAHMDLWLFVRFIHVVAMAFFIGGQLMLAAVVVPVARQLPDREPLRATARRFGYGTLVALAALIITGSMLAGHEQLWHDKTLHIKLGLVLLTGVAVIWHMRRPTMHAIEGLVFLLSLAIVWLGLMLAH